MKYSFVGSFIIASAVLAACSPHSGKSDRYTEALKLYDGYKSEELFKYSFGGTRGQPEENRGFIYDLASSNRFQKPFRELADELSKRALFSENNRQLITKVRNDISEDCDYHDEANAIDVSCDSDSIGYSALPGSILHTSAGNFVVTEAVNHEDDNDPNDSPLITVIDTADGGLGLLIEDQVAVNSRRPEVIAAVLTLVASLGRTSDITSHPPAAKVKADLEDVRQGKVFKVAPVMNEYRPPIVTSSDQTGLAPANSDRVVISKSLTIGKTTLSEFKVSHPGAECFDFGGKSGCEIKTPSPIDCPAQRPCSDVVYSFGGELGYGFLAHYDQDSWMSWKREFTDELGEPELKHVSATPGTSMSSDSYDWRRDGKRLILTHFEGMDENGKPLDNPYSMAFTVDMK